MDWDITDVESLAIIDRAISNNRFSSAEYEIIRQIIYRSADLNYYSLLNFSESALERGALALSARTAIIVDLPEIQLAIAPLLYKTFLSPVYACSNVYIKSESGKSKYALGLEVLAKSNPKGIYIIGREQTALIELVRLAKKKIIQPSLVIMTAPIFTTQSCKNWLKSSSIPYICLNKRKGGSHIAVSIITSLIDLVWYDTNNLIK